MRSVYYGKFSEQLNNFSGILINLNNKTILHLRIQENGMMRKNKRNIRHGQEYKLMLVSITD